MKHFDLEPKLVETILHHNGINSIRFSILFLNVSHLTSSSNFDILVDN